MTTKYDSIKSRIQPFKNYINTNSYHHDNIIEKNF